MVCKSCCQQQKKFRKGLWSPQEDLVLKTHILKYGYRCWSEVPKLAGLQRCGKSCRLRWINYLRPGLRRGTFSSQEETFIINAHAVLGNRWSRIASMLPGRTDNEIKNFWNSHLKKKIQMVGNGTDANGFLGNVSTVENSEWKSTNSTLLADDLQLGFFPNGDLDFQSPTTLEIPVENAMPSVPEAPIMQSEIRLEDVEESNPQSECPRGDNDLLSVMFSEWFYSGKDENPMNNKAKTIQSENSSCSSFQSGCNEANQIISSQSPTRDFPSSIVSCSSMSMSWGQNSSSTTNTISIAEYLEEGETGSYEMVNLAMDEKSHLFENCSILDFDFI